MNYTSIEQAKHLLELGLDPNSADMLWERHNKEEPYVTIKPWTIKGKSIGSHVLPCWSLEALLEVMPKIPRVEYNLVLPGIEDDTPYIAFDDCRENHQVHLNFEGSTPLEAAYNTVCWLLENGYIKKKV